MNIQSNTKGFFGALKGSEKKHTHTHKTPDQYNIAKFSLSVSIWQYYSQL